MVSSLLPLCRSLIDIVFPPVCPACGCLRTPDEPVLCSACYRSLPRTTPDDPLYRDTAEKLCSGDLIDGLISPFAFVQGSALRELVHEMKYGGASRIGLMLGREIGRTISGSCAEVTIPVPLHRTKLRERGYNQSALLCAGISEVTGIPCLRGVLVRSRYTATQTALDAVERAANVRDAFTVRRESLGTLAGSSVILVDDVVTTGATLRACAVALRAAGVERVLAATVGIAP